MREREREERRGETEGGEEGKGLDVIYVALMNYAVVCDPVLRIETQDAVRES